MARYLKRRKTMGRKRSFRPKAKVAAARVRRVVLNMSEKKFFNQNVGVVGTEFPAAITWDFFSALATNASGGGTGIKQGTGASDRLGNKIFLRAIHFTITMAPLFGAGMTNGCVCRVIVYHNKEAVGTLPSGITMFTLNNINSNRAVEYMPKLSVIRDFTHSMVTTAAVAASTPLSVGPMTIKKFSIYPNKLISFTSNTGAISDFLKDDYGFGICATDATGCSVIVNMQTIFSDA